MNQLKMSQQQSIITLWQHGWSFRRIARELQLRRETVSKYVRRYEGEVSKPAKVPAGSPEVAEPKPAISLTGSEPVLEVKPAIPLAGSLVAGRQSLCLPLAAVIESAVQAGLSAQRIYQDLVGGASVCRQLLLGAAFRAAVAPDPADPFCADRGGAGSRGAGGFWPGCVGAGGGQAQAAASVSDRLEVIPERLTAR